MVPMDKHYDTKTIALARELYQYETLADEFAYAREKVQERFCELALSIQNSSWMRSHEANIKEAVQAEIWDEGCRDGDGNGYYSQADRDRMNPYKDDC